MTVSASSGLQNEVRWNHLATDNKQFSKDNRVSEEVGKSAERYTLQEYNNRISHDDSLSKNVRESVAKSINGTMAVGFQAAAPGGVAVDDALAAADDSARGEIRSLDEAAQGVRRQGLDGGVGHVESQDLSESRSEQAEVGQRLVAPNVHVCCGNPQSRSEGNALDK